MSWSDGRSQQDSQCHLMGPSAQPAWTNRPTPCSLSCSSQEDSVEHSSPCIREQPVSHIVQIEVHGGTCTNIGVHVQAITQGLPVVDFVQQLQPQAMANLLQMLPASGLAGSAMQSMIAQTSALLQTQERLHLQVIRFLILCPCLCADGSIRDCEQL